MPEQHWLLSLQMEPMPSHTVWQTPVLMLQMLEEMQHNDDGVHAW
jgi:hypothetical protein